MPCIHVIESSALMFQHIKTLLESFGCDVNTDDAAQCIIIDDSVPSDSYAALKEQNVPLILCSVAYDSATMQKAHALGVDEYIVKPFDAVVLSSKLEQLEVLA